jgi:hypothetical protein
MSYRTFITIQQKESNSWDVNLLKVCEFMGRNEGIVLIGYKLSKHSTIRDKELFKKLLTTP